MRSVEHGRLDISRRKHGNEPVLGIPRDKYGHRVVGKPLGVYSQPPAGRCLNVAVNVHRTVALRRGERDRANARNRLLNGRACRGDERGTIALISIAGIGVGQMPRGAHVRRRKRVGRDHPRKGAVAIGDILDNLTQIDE